MKEVIVLHYSKEIGHLLRSSEVRQSQELIVMEILLIFRPIKNHKNIPNIIKNVMGVTEMNEFQLNTKKCMLYFEGLSDC